MKTLLLGMIIVILANIGERVYANRCDRELRAALISRNQAEQKYFETATQRELLDMKTAAGIDDKIQQNSGDIARERKK